MPVLDAHKGREKAYQAEELLRYQEAKAPKEEQEAMRRRTIMRRARSRKRRPALLAELEKRYLSATESLFLKPGFCSRPQKTRRFRGSGQAFSFLPGH